MFVLLCENFSLIMHDIICFRLVLEGGQYIGDESKRQDALWVALKVGANYIDIELKVEKSHIHYVLSLQYYNLASFN